MIGEIWESAESWLWGDMFDSAMNYDFRKHCRDFFRCWRHQRRLPGNTVTVALNAADETCSLGKALPGKPMLAAGLKGDTLAPFGYAVWAGT